MSALSGKFISPSVFANTNVEFPRGATRSGTVHRPINWAYLIPQPDGQYRLIAERKQFYHISCTLWAPLIDESEIEITTYLSHSLRYGRWNGREVGKQSRRHIVVIFQRFDQTI